MNLHEHIQKQVLAVSVPENDLAGAALAARAILDLASAMATLASLPPMVWDWSLQPSDVK